MNRCYFISKLFVVLILVLVHLSSCMDKKEIEMDAKVSTDSIEVEEILKALNTGNIGKLNLIGKYYTENVDSELYEKGFGSNGIAVFDEGFNNYRSIIFHREGKNLLVLILSDQPENRGEVLMVELIEFDNNAYTYEKASVDGKRNKTPWVKTHYGFVYHENPELGQLSLNQYDVDLVPDKLLIIDFEKNRMEVIDDPSDRYTVYFLGM